ncbi:hypothetical protein DFH08DRAFT_977161 [Mycena albidolilacea]|uniref:Uncharacterized protein n=1 Tax=Mycena albidolilacea TaxID=1033008 RepID=A0AAD7E8Y6_9AGAR|nr:hypothetical protein DFH08DRAFT_977161 [Mycena albidolilacea]
MVALAGLAPDGPDGKHFPDEKHYGSCELCGPTKACKIAANGTQQALSNNQLRAWSHCLAAESSGVTLQTPPNAKLFPMFFKKSAFASGSAAPPANPMQQAQFCAPGQYMPMGNPFGYPYVGGMPPLFSGGHPGIQAPHVPPLPSGSLLPSSDPPDMDAANPYPEIGAFFIKLSVHHPRRDWTKYIALFEDLDFFHIDDIRKLKVVDELVRLVGISVGNGTFLLEQVKDEMKRVDRAAKN